MSDADDRETTLNEVFSEPKKSAIDSESYENHSIPDLIALDQYLKSNGAGSKGSTSQRYKGVMLSKFGFPGTIH